MSVSNNLEIKTEINKTTKTPQEAKAKDYPHKALPPELFSEFVRYLTPTDTINYVKSLVDRVSPKEIGNLLAINLFIENLRGVTDLISDDFKRYKVSYQDLTGKKISNEDFLGFFKNLEALSLDNELATSEVLIILKDFPHLTTLDFTNCDQIQDFSFLKSLPNLTALGFEGCIQIEDFSFLKGLPNLMELDLSGCRQITDVSFLEHFPNLTGLDLSGCIQLEDFSFLGQLTNLKILGLRYCWQMKDYSFLEHLPNLKMLFLYGCNQIKDKSIFDAYPYVEVIWKCFIF